MVNFYREAIKHIKMIEIDSIVPKLGLGDLLSLKRFCLVNDIRFKRIILNSNAIKFYKNLKDDTKYTDFISKFIKNLFDCDIEINRNLGNNFFDDPIMTMDFSKLKKDYVLMKEYFKFEKKFHSSEFEKKNYIVFHTKVRNDESKSFSVPKNKINNFFENFKSKYKILILGERNFSENIESLTNDFHCIYENILLLSKNNRILDLTKPILNDGNIDYVNFEKDLNIISNAKANIIFGVGGPLSLSTSFCEENIIYMEKETYQGRFNPIISSLENQQNLIFTELEYFIDTIVKKFGL